MASPPIVNSGTGVTIATAAVATTLNREATAMPRKNRSSPPMKNAPHCAGWSASSASRGRPSATGSKKSRRAPGLERQPDCAGFAGGRRPGTGRTLVVRAEKEPQALDLARPVPLVTSGSRLRHRRPQRGDLPPVVGAYPGELSHGALLHRLLGGLSERHPGRSTYSSRQRQRPDGSRRTLE